MNHTIKNFFIVAHFPLTRPSICATAAHRLRTYATTSQFDVTVCVHFFYSFSMELV